jgi:tRNA-uridine 2-sulfurtransferase
LASEWAAGVTESGTPHCVAVAMSGGVDSATAAALLREQGRDVIGITMRLWQEPDSGADLSDIADARRVCGALGVSFHVVDFQQAFKAAVVDYFVAAYSHALTPNPCVACNRYIKFGLLLDAARELGAGALATGHYARTEFHDGVYRLLKARDPKKDQSYVLYQLTQSELAHVVFPLGEYTKEQVRLLAHERHLPVASRPESQETCFITDNDYRRFLREHAPASIAPGPILDPNGRIIGRHRGLPFYTIGQRSGLGIAAPEPLFVLDIDPAHNALIAGPAAQLGRSELCAAQVSYVSGRAPEGDIEITAKIRYSAPPAAASLSPLGDGTARVRFAAPLRDITPGQSVVFYQNEEVLGGGIIVPERESR